MKHRNELWRLLGQYAFGKLQCQPCRVCAAFLHGSLKRGNNVPVSQLDSRNVDREMQRDLAVQVHIGCKASDLASAPVTDIENQPGVLGEFNKPVRTLKSKYAVI